MSVRECVSVHDVCILATIAYSTWAMSASRVAGMCPGAGAVFVCGGSAALCVANVIRVWWYPFLDASL